MGHLHPKVVEELELRRHGLENVLVPNVINPTDDDCIVFSKDPKKTREQIARFSRRDAENYPRFLERMQSTVRLLRQLQLETPVDPFRRDPTGLWRTARLAWKLRNARHEVHSLIQTLSLSAYDYVSRWFETEIVQAKFMYWATIGGNVGPYSPGTAFYLVAHLIGQTGMSFARGGMGGISDAIARSGEAHGMKIRTEAPVDEILVRDGRVAGVRLAGGEEIRAQRVISNANAKVTFGGLVRREHLPEDFLEWVDGYRTRGKSFKLLCAIDRLPHYRGFSQEKTGVEYPAYAHICPTPEFLERAFDEAKFGWYSSETVSLADRADLLRRFPGPGGQARDHLPGRGRAVRVAELDLGGGAAAAAAKRLRRHGPVRAGLLGFGPGLPAVSAEGHRGRHRDAGRQHPSTAS